MGDEVEYLSDEELFAEYARRFIKPEFIDDNFPVQKAFIEDPARRKSAICTRRAGKTEGDVRYLLHEGWRHPGKQGLYVGLTRLAAKYIAWPIFKRLNKEMELGLHFHEQELVVTLPNQAYIRLVGADATEDERQKLLGQANFLVIVDECASFKPHINEVVHDVLMPTLIDMKATICMTGTPGEVPAGLFFDITTGKVGGWSRHTWTTEDNPYMRKNFAEEVEELKEANPGIEELPWFRRHYLGEWVLDEDLLVYKFKAEQTYRKLPEVDLTWGLGIDLGWEDPTALVLAAWSVENPKFYFVDSFKKSKMTFHDVELKIQELQEKHRIKHLDHIVIDNASKQGVEDMRQRWRRNFIPATKQGKADFIGIMNTDMALSRISTPLDKCDELIAEWQSLVWQKDKIPRKEDPRCDNHLADAALYIYRQARHFLFEEEVPRHKRGTPQFAQEEFDRMMEQDEEAFHREQNQDPWDEFSDTRTWDRMRHYQ